MVFQSYALYPHLSVYENIAFGLQVKKVPKAEIDRRVSDAARILDLEPFLKRKPRALSGGQRQRVAMGRAIVRQPQAFLMDEPLSNLDAKLRVQMRAEIARLQRDLGVTTIYVTHDQVEAMTMGDRVAVMRKGELQQVASPQELYDRPVNLFVGGFIGSPAMNMVEATIERRQRPARRRRSGSQSTRARRGAARAHGRRSRELRGPQIILGIRPEDLEDAALAPDTPADRRLRGQVELTRGARLRDHGALHDRRACRRSPRTSASSRRTSATPVARAALEGVATQTTIVGRFGARSRVREGDAVEVAVDTRALHFFDPETGLGIYDHGTNERSCMMRKASRGSCSARCVAARRRGPSRRGDGQRRRATSTAGVSGKLSITGVWTRRRAEVVPGRPRRRSRRSTRRQGQVHVGRRQHPDRARDGGPGRPPARPRRVAAARPRAQTSRPRAR